MMIDAMEQHLRTLQVFSAGSARFAVVSIHGRMLTVLDLSQLLDQPRRSKGPSHILALRGDEQLALAIDGPGETIELGDAATNSDFEATTEGKLITGVINYSGDEIKLLNAKELFPTAIQGRERRRRRF
jgi:chemotaxis signal transduction protein